eukprot:2364488-Amphidinium_carterae.1
MTIDELVTWALRVLGIMHMQQDKNMKQMFGSSAGPSNTNPKNTKGPQANAASPDPEGQSKGKAKESKGPTSEGSGQSQKPNKPRQAQGKGPENPIPETFKHFVTDQGCLKGSACVFFHPRVGR